MIDLREAYAEPRPELVEPDQELVDLIAAALCKQRYEREVAGRGHAGLAAPRAHDGASAT